MEFATPEKSLSEYIKTQKVSSNSDEKEEDDDSTEQPEKDEDQHEESEASSDENAKEEMEVKTITPRMEIELELDNVSQVRRMTKQQELLLVEKVLKSKTEVDVIQQEQKRVTQGRRQTRFTINDSSFLMNNNSCKMAEDDSWKTMNNVIAQLSAIDQYKGLQVVPPIIAQGKTNVRTK